MKGLFPLLKKEIVEQVRTYRLVIVGGVFLFFGITTPILFKYLPELIKLAGEQMTIELPPPSAAQALAEYAGTIGQVGVLIAVLVAMGCVANEIQRGTAVITLSKPVSRTAFVLAKLIAASLTFLASLAAASVFCFAYTVWLIEGTGVAAFLGMNLLLGLFLVFCLAVTVLFSSLTRSSLAAGGLAITVLISQAGLSVIPGLGNYMPGRLLGWGINLLAGAGDTYWWALTVTAAAIGLCIYLSPRLLKNRDF